MKCMRRRFLPVVPIIFATAGCATSAPERTGIEELVAKDAIINELKEELECERTNREQYVREQLEQKDKTIAESKDKSGKDKVIEGLRNELYDARTKAQVILKEFVPIPTTPFQDSIIVIYDDAGEKQSKSYISAANYIAYKNMNHFIGNNSELVKFVTWQDPTIKQIANYLTRDCKTNEEAAQALLDFTRRRFYDASSEKSDRDYVKYPLETLVEGGDCEDTAILAAALMKAKGIDVAILVLDLGKTPTHAVVGVCGNFELNNNRYGHHSNGKSYFYAESSGTVWKVNGQYLQSKIGEIPEDYKNKPAWVFAVE